MREIKFRAWSKKGCMMYDVALLRYFKKLERIGLFNNDFRYNGFTQVDLGFVELMQFTGLKDKNGKDIYEGDIIKWNNCNYQIIWGVDGWDLKRLTPDGYANVGIMNAVDYNIIGNIYENPELCDAVHAVRETGSKS